MTLREDTLQKLKDYVASLEQRYAKFISDEMLVYVLEHLIHQEYRRSPDNMSTVAYIATCPIFENILEHKLNAGGNGHHVAQHLAEKFTF